MKSAAAGGGGSAGSPSSGGYTFDTRTVTAQEPAYRGEGTGQFIREAKDLVSRDKSARITIFNRQTHKKQH